MGAGLAKAAPAWDDEDDEGQKAPEWDDDDEPAAAPVAKAEPVSRRVKEWHLSLGSLTIRPAGL